MLVRSTKNLILGVILSCLINHTYSQFFPSRLYSTHDGMPSNSIYEIDQDSTGVMWFVSSRGITNYDGQTWKLLEDSLNLFPNSEFSGIEISDDGTVWVAGQNENEFAVFYLKGQIWSSLELPKGIRSYTGFFGFCVISTDYGTTIFISILNKLYEYNEINRIWKEIIIDPNINDILAKESIVFICTEKGLKIYDGNSIKDYDLGWDLPNEDILTMQFDGRELYVLGFDWIMKSIDGRIEFLGENIGIQTKSLYGDFELVVDHRDRIFYSCDTPLMMFDQDDRKGRVLETKDRIRSGKCNNIFLDHENSVWVASHRGLTKFNLLRFSNYNHESGLLDEEVSSIFQLSNGQILIANACAVNILDNSQITKQFSISSGKSSVCRILDIAESSDGDVYLTTFQPGLFKLEREELRRINFPKKFTYCSSIEYWNSEMFISFPSQGVFRLTGNKLKPFSEDYGIRNLAVVGDRLFGLSRYQSRIYSANGSNPLGSSNRKLNNIYDAIEWRNDVVLATEGGLAILLEDSVVKIDFVGNDDFAVYSLMKDDSENLWIGTDDGLRKWDGSTLDKYDQRMGLLGSEVNRNALIQDGQGRIWVGTESGASMYLENEDLSLDITPITRITDIRGVDRTSYDPALRNIIPFKNNSIEIQFLGISYLDEENISYRYKMEGIDDEWSFLEKNSNTSVRYTNLDAREYTFKVQSRIFQGKWGPTVDTSFIIQNPFYKEWWFTALVVVLIISTLYFLYFIRVRFLLRIQKMLRKEVRIRTQEITDLNRSLENKVLERTQELEDRNKRLSSYAYMNAHLLRAPLVRIMSLIEVIKNDQETSVKPEHMNIIDKSVHELDEVIHSINETVAQTDKDIPTKEHDASST